MSILDHNSFCCATLVAVLAAVAGPARAAGGLVEPQRRYDRLTAHHGRLEGQLAEQSKRIQRLKTQRGVGRDFQLKAALRTSQELAERLTKLQAEIRAARQRLVAAYERAIGEAEGSQRDALRRRRALLAERGRAIDSRIVTDDRASPYDSPDDLEEKADLLKDSEEKVRRQLRQLGQRLERLRHRARLTRHDQAADDSPFVENAPRRTSRTQASRQGADGSGGSTGASRSGDDTAPKSPAVPAQPADPSASYSGAKSNQGEAPAAPPSAIADTDSASVSPPAPAPGPAPAAAPPAAPSEGGGLSVSVSIRDVIDPGLLRRLGQVGASGDLSARIAALRRATTKLDGLAHQLSARAKALRERARQLRRRK